MIVRSVSSVEEWATAIIELRVAGPLPARCVLVPSERVAHSLRRALLTRGAAQALIGTRFATLHALAIELVAEAGESCLVNERERACGVVRDAFEEVALTRFPRADLCVIPGWDVAFARTLSELDAAEIGSATLLSSADAQVRDVGCVLAHVAADETLQTHAALLRRATVLAGRAAHDPLLAVLTGFETLAELRFLRALPGVCLARWLVRPAPREYVARAASTFGVEALPASAPTPLAAPGSALARLQESLFDVPPATPAPDDASVRVVTYAGVHEEVEAAVSWVVEQIVVHQTPLSEIALLAPRAEVYAPLLRARLSALPRDEADEPLEVYSEVALPLIERADGLRLLQVVRALRDGLSRDALAQLLPSLRSSGEGRYVRGLSRAWELLNAVAVSGGERANLRGGRVWPEAWESAMLRLEAPLLSSGALDEREVKQRSDLQADLAGLAPAIEALTDVLRHVVNDEPLSMVWMCLSAFAQRHLVLPFEAPPICPLIEETVSVFEGQEECEPVGVEALAFLMEALTSGGVQRGRYGRPAIYLGTLAGVRGLSFRAVRVLGLVEGALPSAVREDPVLPDVARRALSAFLPTARSRAHCQLAAFDDAVRATSARLVLSAPRVGTEGTTRPPAAALLDVMRTLRRGSQDAGLERQLDEEARRGRCRGARAARATTGVNLCPARAHRARRRSARCGSLGFGCSARPFRHARHRPPRAGVRARRSARVGDAPRGAIGARPCAPDLRQPARGLTVVSAPLPVRAPARPARGRGSLAGLRAVADDVR